mmetsp:Transcript_28276/g.65613  ORF Transcript_28276/g.65613 Transcript_28276/m.65613 type:complete len:440 (-) Transcript_28276:22-1341(-)
MPNANALLATNASDQVLDSSAGSAASSTSATQKCQRSCRCSCRSLTVLTVVVLVQALAAVVYVQEETPELSVADTALEEVILQDDDAEMALHQHSSDDDAAEPPSAPARQTAEETEEQPEGDSGEQAEVESDQPRADTVMTSTKPPKAKQEPKEKRDKDDEKARKKTRIDVMIIVPSFWSETTRRKHVRDSWMQYFDEGSKCTVCHKYKVVVKFMVGRAIYRETAETIAKFHAEMDHFKDTVVLPDFEEQKFFKQRSQKTVACMRYAWENYDFAILLKADTDSYVFAERLLPKLESLGALPDAGRQKRFYMGNFHEGANAKVVTTKDNPKNKWADDTFTDFTGLKYYPTHAKGAGYLLSSKLIAYLAHPPLPLWPFTCEDTAIGALLVPFNITRVDLPVTIVSTGCSRQDTLIDHYVSETDMLERMGRFKSSGNACRTR